MDHTPVSIRGYLPMLKAFAAVGPVSALPPAVSVVESPCGSVW